MSPLCLQLENLLGGEQVYQQRVTQHLVPCVGQFSVALADDSQWKTLNYQILLKTRHPESKVSRPECRLAGSHRKTCRQNSGLKLRLGSQASWKTWKLED